MNNNIIVVADSPEDNRCLKGQLTSIGEKNLSLHDYNDVTGNALPLPSGKLLIYQTTKLESSSINRFKNICSLFPDIPIIVISEDSYEAVLKLVSFGAQDHLVKGEYGLSLLKKSIYYAIERHKLVKEIAQTKIDYQGIFMDNPTPMWIYDPDTLSFLQVNQAALHNYGYTKDEFLSMTIKDIRPKDDLEKLTTAMANRRGNNIIDGGIWRHKKASGEIFYVHVCSHTTTFKEKQARLVVAIDVNTSIIHEQKNEELTRKLKTYSDRINTILNSITDGFFAVDEEWNFTYVNQVFENIFGTGKGSLTGKNIWNVLPKNFSDKIGPKYEQAMKTKKHYQFEEYLDTKDIWFSVSVYPSKEGLSAYVQDVTRSKHMKERIFNEQMKLNALINNTDDPIWSVDKNFNVLTANDSAKQIMKRFNAQGIKEGKNIFIEGLDKKLKSDWEAYYRKALHGATYQIEYKVDLPGDPLMFLEVSFNPIKNQQGEIFGVGCYAHDITERKKHQLTIERHNQLLEEIAWKQSHTMRGPVASIMGIMEVFDFENMNAPFNKELLQHLRLTTEKLDRLIKEVVLSTIPLDNEDEHLRRSSF